jgi:hypothetical protein
VGNLLQRPLPKPWRPALYGCAKINGPRPGAVPAAERFTQNSLGARPAGLRTTRAEPVKAKTRTRRSSSPSTTPMKKSKSGGERGKSGGNQGLASRSRDMSVGFVRPQNDMSASTGNIKANRHPHPPSVLAGRDWYRGRQRGRCTSCLHWNGRGKSRVFGDPYNPSEPQARCLRVDLSFAPRISVTPRPRLLCVICIFSTILCAPASIKLPKCCDRGFSLLNSFPDGSSHKPMNANKSVTEVRANNALRP